VKPVTEAELHTYIDGALSEGARAEVEAWLVSHPEDAERLRRVRRAKRPAPFALQPVLDEPVPAALLAVRRTRGGATPRQLRYLPSESGSAGSFAGCSLARRRRRRRSHAWRRLPTRCIRPKCAIRWK